MPQLIAQGPQPSQRWRRRLEPGRCAIIGRSGGAWNVPWDDRVSRQHAQLTLEGGRLHLRRLPEARNPIFYQGRACDTCQLSEGEHFVIGSTSFTLVEERLEVTLDAPRPQTEQVFPAETLHRAPFRDASHLIDALSRLPEVISNAGSDDELFVQIVNLLFRSIEAATIVAVVSCPVAEDDAGPIHILHWDRPPDCEAAPSERLIRQAVQGGASVVHLWQQQSGGATFTHADEVNWAFCTPVRSDACRGWALYVAGSGGVADPAEVQDEVKFAELVALTLASVCSLRQLERHKATLGQFISPLVLSAVADRDPEEVLAPHEADISVLFCDLRGFSRKSEEAADDLMGLLQRVSMALGVMTRHILAADGVIGDFHGDAAMGFWGWPLPQEDAVAKACQAALAILQAFSTSPSPDHPLADFRVGIGLASGRAVAGKIGTVDQVKVTVFGPVVNLASRLEAMTKQLRAPILLDEATAEYVRQHVPADVARVRRVARIRPYGLNSPVVVSQLLPPAAQYPQLSDRDIVTYEAALDALQAGDWERAFALLHAVPAEDRVKDFLTVFIAQNHRVPPPGWDGVIPLRSKQ